MQDGVRSGLAVLLAANRIIARRAVASSTASPRKKLTSNTNADTVASSSQARHDHAQHPSDAASSLPEQRASLADVNGSGGEDAKQAVIDALMQASSQSSSTNNVEKILQPEATHRRALQVRFE